MIRLLFVLFFTLLFFSCETSSDEVDPLFYQISEADSVRYMDEIIAGFRNEAIENQRFEEENSMDLYHYCIHQRLFFEITLGSRGDVHFLLDIDTTIQSVKEKVTKYFMFNRNLSSKRTMLAAMDSSHPGFEYPFFNYFEMEEIQQKITESTKEWNELKQMQGADSALIDYYYSKVDEWKSRENALISIGTKTLPEISFQAKVSVEYPESSSKSEEVLNDVAVSFYQLRNYECMRYFNETYLSLYERAQRKNRKQDNDKLATLELLRPISFLDIDRSKTSPSWKLILPNPELNEDFTP